MESFAEKFRAATEAIIAEAVEYLKSIDWEIEFTGHRPYIDDTYEAARFDGKDSTFLGVFGTVQFEGERWFDLEEIEGEKLCALADTIKDILKYKK